MADILYKAAVEYEKLLDKGYNIVLGRKCKTFQIQLRFSRDSFFHLIGLQHLRDITFPSKNKERIYKNILDKKITNEMLQKSIFYDSYFIEERILYLEKLEEMLDSSKVLFQINHMEYIQYTTIRANYLCEYQLTENEIGILYFFIVKESHGKVKNEYRGCSFFKKHETDYKRGTSETKLLLNIKLLDIGKESKTEMELYRHPHYMESS